MNKISRPLVYTLVAVLILAVLAFLLATYHSGPDAGVHLVMFDEDMSDSPLGWAIAIPVMIFVGIVVMAVMAGVAMIVTAALALAAVLVVLVITLAFTPLAVFFALPLLAIYGLYKLIQRDRRAMQAA